jgi:hypothetical protein
MKDKENIYKEWKTSRSGMDPPDQFSDRVMAQIARQDQERSEPSGIPPILEKAIDILVGFGLSVLGAFRVAHLVGSLLLP